MNSKYRICAWAVVSGIYSAEHFCDNFVGHIFLSAFFLVFIWIKYSICVWWLFWWWFWCMISALCYFYVVSCLNRPKNELLAADVNRNSIQINCLEYFTYVNLIETLSHIFVSHVIVIVIVIVNFLLPFFICSQNSARQKRFRPEITALTRNRCLFWIKCFIYSMHCQERKKKQQHKRFKRDKNANLCSEMFVCFIFRSLESELCLGATNAC